jgi:hypothetical protein
MEDGGGVGFVGMTEGGEGKEEGQGRRPGRNSNSSRKVVQSVNAYCCDCRHLGSCHTRATGTRTAGTSDVLSKQQLTQAGRTFWMHMNRHVIVSNPTTAI